MTPKPKTTPLKRDYVLIEKPSGKWATVEMKREEPKP